MSSEGQSKKLRMKVCLTHSPASVVSSAGSRAALSLVVPLRASQQPCTVLIVGICNSERPENPRNPSLVPRICDIPDFFAVPSHSFFIEVTLQERCFIFSDPL